MKQKTITEMYGCKRCHVVGRQMFYGYCWPCFRKMLRRYR